MSNLASIVTILSLGIVPAWYFWKKNQDEKNERSRASRNLYIELNDALDGLDSEKYLNDFKEITLNNGNIVKFMNRALNHDFYDSLGSSGKLNFLKPELQQEIQDTFQKIKDHNFHIRKIRDIEDNAYLNEDILLKTTKYYEILEMTEISLLNEIPQRKEKLKEEFKID